MSHPEKSFAVVIGVETYTAWADWNLDGPASDACRFVAWLRQRGVPAAQIRLFLSPLEENRLLVQQLDVTAQAAEQSLVNKALTDYLPQQAGDLLLFFWGGHGVIDAAGNRRLFYADATQSNLRHLNLTNLLTSWRTDYLKGFSRQICCIDACANYVEYMRKAFSMPEETYPAGTPAAGLEQFVLLAASPGELAQNQTAVKSGAFSAALLEQLTHSGSKWPPEMTKIHLQLQQHFVALHDVGQVQQTPAYFWYRDWQGNEDAVGTLVRRVASVPIPAGTKNELSGSAIPVKQQQELNDSDHTELVDLLRRSGRANSSARQALCIEIGIDPDTLDFLTGVAPRDFALQFVSHLHQTGNITAILRLCESIIPVLGGYYKEKLITIRKKITGEVDI